MKEILFILMILLLTFNSNSQHSGARSELQPLDYLKKSKKQKKIGFILLGSGATVFTAGAIALQQSESKGENEFPFIIGGLLTVTASIPFFISSGVNRRRAKIEMKRETLRISPSATGNFVYNSITLKLDLGMK